MSIRLVAGAFVLIVSMHTTGAYSQDDGLCKDFFKKEDVLTVNRHFESIYGMGRGKFHRLDYDVKYMRLGETTVDNSVEFLERLEKVREISGVEVSEVHSVDQANVFLISSDDLERDLTEKFHWFTRELRETAYELSAERYLALGQTQRAPIFKMYTHNIRGERQTIIGLRRKFASGNIQNATIKMLYLLLFGKFSFVDAENTAISGNMNNIEMTSEDIALVCFLYSDNVVSGQRFGEIGNAIIRLWPVE